MGRILIDKSKVLGQFFTKEDIAGGLLGFLCGYRKYTKDIRVLEPSSGTGSFLNVLKKKGFRNVESCEVDPALVKRAVDFFDLPLEKKYDLVIGNPPFTKYNLKDSYYFPSKYLNGACPAGQYLPPGSLKKEKEKVENAFILKSLRHLKGPNSTIAFILPVSFFIRNKNKVIKEQLLKTFSTVVVLQNDDTWFDYHIPCCFGIFTNTKRWAGKIVLNYQGRTNFQHVMDIRHIHEEIIPKVFYHKAGRPLANSKGRALGGILASTPVRYKRSFVDNNVSAANILSRTVLFSGDPVSDYKLGVVRVGNSSVGRCGLININKDVLNDMFYVFDFQDAYQNDGAVKQKICAAINENQDYFKDITCRVGSKSIKKKDVLDYRIEF